MITRWTLWENETGEALQMALCVLDEAWEPLWERTVACGPFHDREERRLELLDDLRRWLRTSGYQAELPF